MNLTQHFSFDELTRSDYAVRHGINNTPPDSLLINLQMLAEGLERVRAVLQVPLHISSGYRSPSLNSAVNGSRTSAHMDGRAADFTAERFGSPSEVVTKMLAHRHVIQADQVILEFDRWVHVSFSKVPRNEFLKFDGKVYTRIA